MLRELEMFGKDLQRLAKDDPKGFCLYIALMFLCCEIIHTCLVL